MIGIGRRSTGVSAYACVILGVAASPGAAADAPAPAAAPSAASAHFMIRAFQVVGNHWIAPGKVEELVYPFMGPGRTSDDVEKARSALQAEFEKEGYASVSVAIPEQGVDTGIIRLEIEPQAIGNVTVSGARKPDRLLAEAPSLKTGIVPNFHDVQHDVVALNGVASRKVTPEVKAGVAPGTVDVNLKVEETSAFHASAEINNYKSPSTTDLRTLGTLRYDDLWAAATASRSRGRRRPGAPATARWRRPII